MNTWILIAGIVILLIGLICIYISTNHSFTNKQFFNISRSLVVISAIGLWYFGFMINKEMNKQINTSREIAAGANLQAEEAKKETANAMTQFKNMELELQQEKNLSKTLDIQVKTLELQIKQADNERKKIKSLQKQISTFEIKINIKLPTIERPLSKILNVNSSVVSTIPNAVLKSKNASEICVFSKVHESTMQQSSSTTMNIFISFKPKLENTIISNNITILKNYKELELALGQLMPFDISEFRSQIDYNKDAEFFIQIDVNGKNYKAPVIKGDTFNMFERNRTVILPIDEFLNDIVTKYLLELGEN